MAVIQDININVHGQPSEKRLQTFLRLSQNENGRMINFRVLGAPLPSGCTATFSGTKPDGNVYSTTGTVAGNFVMVQEDMQMTAVAGVWDATLDVVNGTHNIVTAIIRVIVERGTVAPGSVPSNSQLDGYVAQCKSYAEQARMEAYGSPLTAETKAQMTDHKRAYVYTGSEPNMVAGNWYYWNGSAWTSGGVYNAVAVQTDKTLTVQDKPADGKATGDALNALKEDLTAVLEGAVFPDVTVADFVRGYWQSGEIVSSNYRICTKKMYSVIAGDTLAIAEGDLQIGVYIYPNGDTTSGATNLLAYGDNKPSVYTIPVNGLLFFVARKSSDGTVLPSEFDGEITCYSKNSADIAKLQNDYTQLSSIDPIEILGVLKAAPSSPYITSQATCRTVFAKCIAEEQYTVSKIATNRFSVFFTQDVPVISDSVEQIMSDGYTVNRTASSITVIAPEGAEYICAYIYNSSTDSDIGTATEIINSTTVALTTAKDLTARHDLIKNTVESNEKMAYLESLVALEHGLIDYGYETPYYSEPETATYNLGIRRNGMSVKVDTGASLSENTFVRISGDVAIVRKNSGVSGLTGGVTLTVGHTYSVIVRRIAGTCVSAGNETTPSVSVYRSGESSSVGTYVRPDTHTFIRTFTADTTLYNMCIYLTSTVSCDGVELIITLVDETPTENKYDSEIADTVSKARSVNTEPSLVFPIVTDIHRYASGWTQTFDEMINNMSMVASAVKTDFIANLGDTIDGDVASATSIGYAHHCTEQFMSIGLQYLFAQGNHDNNPYKSSGTDLISLGDTVSCFYSVGRPTAYNEDELGTDYYVDFDALGVRVISLNSNNVSVKKTYAFGDSTATWLTGALDTDKTVILMEHVSSIETQVWNNGHPTHSDDITATLTAFANGGGNLIQFSGHSHADIVFIDPWLSIVLNCQKCMVSDLTTEEFGMITGYIDDMDAPERTSGTYEEDCWSFCIYKPFSNTLHVIRFGSGADRHFNVTPIAPTTVSSILGENVTWSTSDDTVATVNGGTITGVATGKCAILAKDSVGNCECWIVEVT